MEMGLTTDDLRVPIREPLEEYDGARHHPSGRRVRRGANGVCVVFVPKEKVVLTLLWDRAIGRDRHGQPVA